MLTIVFATLIMTAYAQAPFSPLSTFYDIDVSTTASYFQGKSFGPGCALGGTVPFGFVGVAMNGLNLGLSSPAAACGMCLAIRGSPPATSNPAENQGIVGEYYAYVYEVCEDCSQSSSIKLGLAGQGQSTVVWRAIPCPQSSEPQPYLFFDGAKESRARFQIRGLSSPIINAKVQGHDLPMHGSFFVYESNNDTSIYPFSVGVTTALGEQVEISVPAYREYGKLSDLIVVKRLVQARPTAIGAPKARTEYGSGELTTTSGNQTRTIQTVNQAGRQIITIINSPGSLDYAGVDVGSQMQMPSNILNDMNGLANMDPIFSVVNQPATQATSRPIDGQHSKLYGKHKEQPLFVPEIAATKPHRYHSEKSLGIADVPVSKLEEFHVNTDAFNAPIF